MFFDYDPLTGVRYDFDYDEVTGDAFITYSEDVQTLLDRNADVRNHGLADRNKKAALRCYASLPLTVIMEMRGRGIDVFKGDDTARVLEEINTRYPYLKTTDLNHGGKVKQIYVP